MMDEQLGVLVVESFQWNHVKYTKKDFIKQVYRVDEWLKRGFERARDVIEIWLAGGRVIMIPIHNNEVVYGRADKLLRKVKLAHAAFNGSMLLTSYVADGKVFKHRSTLRAQRHIRSNEFEIAEYYFELCEEQPDWYTIVARGQGQDTPVKFLANVLAQEVRLVEGTLEEFTACDRRRAPIIRPN